MNTTHTCPVCLGQKSQFFISYQSMELFRCSTCELVYLDPLPNVDTQLALYTDAYQGATDSYFKKPASKLRRSRGRAKQLARYVKPPALFLDVGANGGFMVEAAREQGFIAHGLEPDPVSISYAKKHYPLNSYHQGFLEQFEPNNLQFDAIYCSEVIEHSPTPRAFVAAFNRLMKLNGVLYLTTPEIDHWLREKDVTQWVGFCPPSHCIYFNRNNITRLLNEFGFEVLRFRFGVKPGIKLFARKIRDVTMSGS